MNTYQELSLRYLKSQKKRSILTLIGIILSVSLLCCAGIMGVSLQNSMVENVKQTYGFFHVSYMGVSESQIQRLQQNAKVEKTGYKLDVGFSVFSGGKRILVTGFSPDLPEMLYLKPISGRLPQNPGEIAIEQWVLDNMPGKPSVGDIISLEVTSITDMKAPNAASSKLPNQTLTFKLVGALENSGRSQYSQFTMALITIQGAKDLLRDQNPRYDAAVQIKAKLPMQTTIQELTQNLGVQDSQVSQNTAMLTAIGQSRSRSNNNTVFIIELVAILVIIITTIAVIYNAFHISVVERIRQFGILRSTGTTPRQIRGIVLREALILAIIGIPLGILLGIAGFQTVMNIFSSQTLGFLSRLHIVIPLSVIAGTAGLGLVTVLVSALGPVLTAGRVTPMEAILQTAKLNREQVKKRKLARRIIGGIFGIEGAIAAENLRRNPKRFFVTVFSMCIGIALFVFFSAFMYFLNAEVQQYFSKDFALDKPFSSSAPGYTLQDYENVTRIKGVKTVYRVMQKNVRVLISKDQETADLATALTKMPKQDRDTYQYGNFSAFPAHFYGYRERELNLCKTNLIQGTINTRRLDQSNGVLVAQRVQLKNSRGLNVSQLKPGDVIRIMDGNGAQNAKPVELTVMGILDTIPLDYYGGLEKFGIITTETVFRKITGSNTFGRFDIEVRPDADRNQIKTSLQGIAAGVTDGNVLNYGNSSTAELQLELGIILFGLVTVISIIGALNIINTISTNLILRTREFGTLRAVGMTPGQMKKMINLEGLLYGLIASFYGSIAGGVLARIMYDSLNKLQGITWHLPWEAMIEASLAAMLLGIAATIVPLKRISRMNVVESVRAEE
ncbi:MAG TPA: ABC transporter permease [Bacillota bacterium]|nr:ABC transporter permease [Bacillota bacterium]